VRDIDALGKSSPGRGQSNKDMLVVALDVDLHSVVAAVIQRPAGHMCRDGGTKRSG
jgi:hypothetical protein